MKIYENLYIFFSIFTLFVLIMLDNYYMIFDAVAQSSKNYFVLYGK
jgi:hypothetical protein